MVMTLGLGLEETAAAVRGAIGRHADWAETAELVAAALRKNLPGPEILPEHLRDGSPDGYQTHTLHVEPDGAFSLVGVVWRPGQRTPIHDHVTWCVVGVLRGAEHEQLYALHDDGLVLAGENVSGTGEVCGFAPPGDIHRVTNTSDVTAISLHVYGTDITRVGSSVRRLYEG